MPLEKAMPHGPDAPIPSASVILVDPAPGAGEPFRVFLLRRRASSSFMPNRFVFPGGTLEPGDGPAHGEGLLVCAIRELWEEAGVLLARGKGENAVWDPGELALWRGRVHAQEATLGQALSALGLAPDFSALIPHARWITPKARPKRFDARFYLAKMPKGQRAQSDEAETKDGLWLSPARALEENLQGEVELAPPQVRILGELAGEESVEVLLAGRPEGTGEPITPVLVITDTARVVLLPWDPDHAAGELRTPSAPCPAGEASRLVNRKGRWFPEKI